MLVTRFFYIDISLDYIVAIKLYHSRDSGFNGIVVLRQPLVAVSWRVALLARCETNDKEKTAAIAEAEARITDLTSTIEELTATSARLNTEIKNLEAEIAKNQEASVVGA